MPYDYRSLSPEERADILRWRKEHGYPLHSPPHPIHGPGYYHISAACFEHAPVMNTYERRNELETRLLTALRAIQAEVIAWVVLPDHYHFLAYLDRFESLPGMLKTLHTGTAYEWNRADGRTGQRRVWYHYTDRFMRSENQMVQTFNYIHFNPV